MPELDFRAPRLFVDAPLREGERIALERNQSNYLGNVLRLSAGENILVFNGRDGEWQAADRGPQAARRPDDRRADAAAGSPARHRLCLCAAETRPPRLHGAEGGRDGGLGAAAGVDAAHPGFARQRERMRANVIEAAEQCGILSLAAVAEPIALDRFLEKRETRRLLVFCDEAADIGNPIEALQQGLTATEGIDVLIGPEGGFAEEERALLLRQPRTLRLSLGPRILRADTAGVAALALVQAALGDWRGPGQPTEAYPLSHRPLIQLANPCRNAAPAMLRPAPTRPSEPRGTPNEPWNPVFPDIWT